MHTCRHCGRENQDDATLCSECGLELGPSVIERAVSQVRARSGGFFRWRAASIILIILMVIYGLTSPLNIWLGSVASQRGDAQISRVLYWGAFWNAVVAILCFTARRLMQRQTRTFFAASVRNALLAAG